MLPNATNGNFAQSKNAQIWYAVFGNENGPVVTLLHGGGANSNYWGNLIPELITKYKVIVVDSRGQGRSPFNGQTISYELMAGDVIAVLDALNIRRTAIVGWSDGAITGFYITLLFPDRVTGHLAFAGVADLSGEKGASGTLIDTFHARIQREHLALSKTQNYERLRNALSQMWRTQPTLTRDDLKRISVTTWVVHAEHDEIVRYGHAKYLVASIPRAQLIELRGVSHFALLQDPTQFNASVIQFLNALSAQ